MTNPKWFASLVLSATVVSTVSAETRCPGNVASLTPRIVQGALIVIPVKVNEAGTFDSTVDTGSQITYIDPSLASQLDLKAQSRFGLVSVASYAQASAPISNTL